MRTTTPTSRRRALVLGALTATALTLGACGASGGASAGNGNDGGSGSGSDGGPVSIEYWHRLPSVEGAKSVDDLVAEWNEDNPDVQVKATALQGAAADAYPKIATAVEAGNAPCLAQVGVDRVPDLLSTGRLLDVTEQASQYEENYLPYAWSRATFDGATYGIPQDTGPLVLYYRADLFEEYGIDVPKTWDDFRAAAQTVKEHNPEARLASFLPDEAMWFMALSSANGAQWWGIDGDRRRVDIDSAPTQEVAEYWQGLIDEDLVATTPRWTRAFDQALADGTLVATVGASWEAPLIAGSAPDTAGKWAVAQIPMWDTGKPLVGEDGGSIVAVLNGCEQPEAAVAFADWLNTNVEGLMPLGLFPATEPPAEGFATPETLVEFYGGQEIYDEFAAANEAVNPTGLRPPPA